MSSNDPAYAAALASQQRGAGYISEQQDLKATGLFVYSLSDELNDPLNAMGDWALQQAKSAGRGATNLGNALLKKIAQNGPQGPYVNPDDLNGPSGGGNGTPPTATAVVTPIPCPAGPGACGMAVTPVVTPVVTPGAPTMSAGGSDDSSGGGSASSSGPQATNNVGFDTSNLESKLSGYLLDPAHPQNQTKANWFSQALGFDQRNWQDLASQLYFDPATAVPTKTTQYGQTYEQVIPITGANGKTIDTSFVFMKDNSGTVRLVTGIPAKK
ncbi:DUF6883 domain-containing protein [Burkholderia vietnamiensis]|uniref:DUF6883 domain-containing protein n=1 Tax=Burkholderia vietnamiensis TaxID=60552 RepID=UPI001E30FEDF|nr:DUF6883 domain-containing protein [Burkholderia vietnamiensis]